MGCKRREKQDRDVKEEIHVTMFKQVQFSISFCKRMAKPYPDGPVDQRDSFRVNLCDNFILDIAIKISNEDDEML